MPGAGDARGAQRQAAGLSGPASVSSSGRRAPNSSVSISSAVSSGGSCGRPTARISSRSTIIVPISVGGRPRTQLARPLAAGDQLDRDVADRGEHARVVLVVRVRGASDLDRVVGDPGRERGGEPAVAPGDPDQRTQVVGQRGDHRAARGDVAVGLRAQRLHERRVDVADQGVLAGEVVVGRRVADACGRRDVLDAGPGPPAGGEGRVRRAQQGRSRPVTLRPRGAGPRLRRALPNGVGRLHRDRRVTVHGPICT